MYLMHAMRIVAKMQTAHFHLPIISITFANNIGLISKRMVFISVLVFPARYAGESDKNIAQHTCHGKNRKREREIWVFIRLFIGKENSQFPYRILIHFRYVNYKILVVSGCISLIRIRQIYSPTNFLLVWVVFLFYSFPYELTWCFYACIRLWDVHLCDHKIGNFHFFATIGNVGDVWGKWQHFLEFMASAHIHWIGYVCHSLSLCFSLQLFKHIFRGCADAMHIATRYSLIRMADWMMISNQFL